MIETAQAFGVDIGGSGIKAAPVNLEKGEFAERVCFTEKRAAEHDCKCRKAE